MSSTYRQPFGRGSFTSSKPTSKASKSTVPEGLRVKIDAKRIDVDALRPWISERVTQLLGVEDEVLNEMIASTIENGATHRDGSAMLEQLRSFLDADAETFCVELWEMLASAQENASASKTGKGVPTKLMRDVVAERAKADAAYERMRANRERRERPRGDGRGKPYDKPRRRDDSREPRRRSRWEGVDGARSDGEEDATRR